MDIEDIPDDLSGLYDADEAHQELDIEMEEIRDDLFNLRKLSIRIAREVRARIMQAAPVDDLIDSNLVCMSIQTNTDVLFNIAVSLKNEALWRVDVMANPPCECEDHCENE